MKNLVKAKAPTVDVDFLDEKVKVRQFTVSEVKQLDAAGKGLGEKANFDEQFELIRMTIRMGVEGAEELTDEDFEGFPMGALTKLSEDVMEVSGLGGGAAAGN